MARRDARVKYPWAEWLDGQEHSHTTEQGERFRRYLYEYASKHDLYVTATIRLDSVRFQFFDTTEEYQAGKFERAPRRNMFGQFYERPDHPAINRYCVICGKGLTPAAMEGETECHKMDWSIGQPYKVHSPENTVTN